MTFLRKSYHWREYSHWINRVHFINSVTLLLNSSTWINIAESTTFPNSVRGGSFFSAIVIMAEYISRAECSLVNEYFDSSPLILILYIVVSLMVNPLSLKWPIFERRRLFLALLNGYRPDCYSWNP